MAGWNVEHLQIGYVDAELLIFWVQSVEGNKLVIASRHLMKSQYGYVLETSSNIISVCVLLANTVPWTWNIFVERNSVFFGVVFVILVVVFFVYVATTISILV